MTGGAESVLIALVKMPPATRANLKLTDLARRADVHVNTCSKCIRALVDQRLITANRPYERGNVCYSFSVTQRGQYLASVLGLALNDE